VNVLKNHIRVGNRVLQTNKRFSTLKQPQKEWIHNELKARYIEAIKYPDQKLSPSTRDGILEDVYALIQERKIWIPYSEVKRYYSSKISSFLKAKRKEAKKQVSDELTKTRSS
jgi:hypothetical protein